MGVARAQVSVDRVGVVLAAMADVDGDAPTVISRVCVAAVGLLRLTGCGISLMFDGRLEGSAGVSDRAIANVQELQLELGEGPCVDGWTRDEPVGEADLADPSAVRWPAFTPAAVGAGVGAVFAFPMHQGAIRIGVLVAYCIRPQAWLPPSSGADTIVEDFDVIEFLHRVCERYVELLDCQEAGVLLADSAGFLRVMASSSERSDALELSAGPKRRRTLL